MRSTFGRGSHVSEFLQIRAYRTVCGGWHALTNGKGVARGEQRIEWRGDKRKRRERSPAEVRGHAGVALVLSVKSVKSVVFQGTTDFTDRTDSRR